jgi:osmotically inducible protein OsmC
VARRIAYAEWTGDLGKGTGDVRIGAERLGLAYTPAWLQEGAGTNPEEILAAAHAASFATTLGAAFSRAHHQVQAVRARAELHLDHLHGSWTITRSDLECQVSFEKESSVRDMFPSEFQRVVDEAAASCPVSRTLAGVEITVDAEPAGSDAGADSSPAELGSTGSRAERVRGGRARRALEGRVMSDIRTQSRRRHSTSPRTSPALAHSQPRERR